MKIKIMTFNLRYPAEGDGINYFINRLDHILSCIRREAPDVIGFQEAVDLSFDSLSAALPDYVFIGHGRDKHYRGEGTPIAYRRDRLYLHSFRVSWLSSTPTTPASRFRGLDQSDCPRIFSAATLVSRETGTPFVFYNTHNDHRGSAARLAECELLMGEIEKEPFPFVLVGDFNARPNDPSITLITKTADTLGTVDLTAHIKGTFHGFGGSDCLDKKIDYIFTNLPADATECYPVPDRGEDGVYYSDHNAICAMVEIGN